jgi:hypothetical protein
MVQALNSSGDKVTDAVVNFTVYYFNLNTEVWESFDNGLMTHMGDGIYQASWQPVTLGEYVFYAYCSNPKFHQSYTYNIEKDSKQKIWVQQEQVISNPIPVTQNYLYNILAGKAGGVRVDYLQVTQTNDENAQKGIAIYIVENGGSNRGCSATIPHNTTYVVSLQSVIYGWSILDISLCPLMFGWSYWGGGDKIITNPHYCRSIDIQVALTDAPGTNQRLTVYCMYALLEDLEKDDEVNPM